MNRIRQIAPKQLRPHRANNKIYADGSVADLVESIRAHGILQPLVATPAMTVVSGHRRLRAAEELGIKKVPVIVKDVDDELRAIVEYNRARQKRPSEVYRELLVVLPSLRATAADRRRAGGSHGGRTKGQKGLANAGQTLPPRRVLDDAAAMVGMRRETLRKLLAVFEAHNSSRLPKAVLEALDEGRITINEAHRRMKKHLALAGRQEDLRRQIKNGTLDLSDLIRPFDVLYFWQRDRRFDELPDEGATLDPGFGSPPAQLWVNLLHFFSAPGDLVVDLTAGMGSVAKVCAAMDRRCQSFDLTPNAKNIRRHDLHLGLPRISHAPSLIVLDPPFANQRRFTGDPRDLAACGSTDQFLDIIEKVGTEALARLRGAGHLAVLMGNAATGNFRDLVFETAVRLSQHGRLVRRIAVPYPPSHFVSGRVADAKRRHRLLSLTRELLVFAPKT